MSEETKVISLSKLIRYNNKLKPLVITDAEIADTNKLRLKYLDNNTKELTLPSGGGSPVFPTRSVTRIPMYFEIHFQIQDGNDDQVSSKLNIPLDFAKDIIKIYSKTQSSRTPLGFTVISDVTEAKKLNDYDTVFLAAVNCNPKEFYDIDYEIVVSMETSFGDFNLQSAPFISAVNDALDNAGEQAITLPETIPAQSVAGSRSELQIYASSGENKNRYILKAVLLSDDFTAGDRATSNNTVSIRHNGDGSIASASVSFRLSLEEVEADSTAVTFTETVIQ